MPIQPLAASLAATPQVQVDQSAKRAAQLRREQERLKLSSIDQDTLEHQVESADAVDEIHDKPEQAPSPKRPPKHKRSREDDVEPPHIDISA